MSNTWHKDKGWKEVRFLLSPHDHDRLRAWSDILRKPMTEVVRSALWTHFVDLEAMREAPDAAE